jgi:PAS domain S-box-containing protein
MTVRAAFRPIGAEEDRLLAAITRLFEVSHLEIIVVDMAGKIAYVSPAMLDAGGHSAEKLLGQDVNVLHARLEPVDREIWRTIASGKAWRGRMWGKREDGTIRWTHADISPVRSDDGTIAFAMAVCRQLTPVTEGRPVHAMDREQECAPDFVLVAGIDGTIQFISHTVPGLFPDEVIGGSIFQYVPPDQHQLLRTQIEQVVRTGQTRRYEITSVGPNGSASRYDTRLDPIMHEHEVVAFSFSSCDITNSETGRAGDAYAGLDLAAAAKRNLHGDRASETDPQLSERERQVLALLAEGRTNRDSAQRLGLSVRTVDHHVSNLLKKLRARNRTAAVLTARRLGFLAPRPGS